MNKTHYVQFPPDPADNAIDNLAAKLWQERVKGDKRDETIARLRKENTILKRQLAAAKSDIKSLEADK